MEVLIKPKDVDVVILCGGRGERLRPVVNGLPKPMCEFGGRPFLSILMEYAAHFGFGRFILCAGYKGDMIKEYYTERPEPWETVFCLEKEALGTAGAIKNAKSFIQSGHFLVMNGDSFSAISLDKFLEFHLDKKALLTMALVKGLGNKNSGKATLNRGRRIVRFEEKKINKDRGFDSAGIYFMERSIFSFMKDTAIFSLEYDLFPSILDEKCFGYVQEADIIDFGTPQRYRRAQVFFAKGSVLA